MTISMIDISGNAAVLCDTLAGSCTCTYGHVLRQKAMTTFFTAIRQTRRFRSRSGCKTGTGGYLMEPSVKAW